MNKNDLLKEFEIRNISCDEKQADLLIRLMNCVLLTNEKFNLTAIKNEDEFIEKMIFDSSLALVNNDLENKTILDIGTGAGFPSLVIKILSPSINVIAMDSTEKKINFIKDFIKENNIDLTAITSRAEIYANNNRESLDYVVARAVSSLRILIELAMPMLKVGGCLIAMKGPGYEEEINESSSCFKKLKCHIDHIYGDILPESNEKRYIIYIKKDQKTDKKYPREYQIIKQKQP